MNANLHDPTLANRYLTDKLSEQERHDYEALLVSSPDAVSELEATARLKVGLLKLRETGELDHLLERRTPSLHNFLTPLAAALAVIVIGVTLWLPKLRHPGQAPLLFASHVSLVEKSGRSLPVAVTAAFYSKRAAIPVERIEKPATPSAVVLRVLPAPLNRSHAYRLSLSRLRDAAFEVLAQIGDLKPADDGFIECYADSARLTPGRYEVIVTDQATPPGTAAGVFMFDLIGK